MLLILEYLTVQCTCCGGVFVLTNVHVFKLEYHSGGGGGGEGILC